MTQLIVGNFVPGRIPRSTIIALGMFVGTSVLGNRFMLREGIGRRRYGKHSLKEVSD